MDFTNVCINCLLGFAGLEEYGSDKSKCQEHFDIYKECKKKERIDLLSSNNV